VEEADRVELLGALVDAIQALPAYSGTEGSLSKRVARAGFTAPER